MRKRGLIGLGVTALGIILIAFSIGSFLAKFSTVPSTITGIAGLVILLVGLLLFVTDLIENWLTKSQTALVDGLQAG